MGHRVRQFVLAVAATAALVVGGGPAAGPALAIQGHRTAKAVPRQVSPVTDPAAMVNTLIGTSGDSNNPSGSVNTFPGPDVPFGMVQWSPDSYPNRNAGGGYEYSDTQFRGFSLTHLSGPGCGAAEDVPIEPLTGGVPSGTDPGSFMQPLSHTGEVATAGYYSVQTGSPAITTELTATLRSAMARFTYPATNNANVLLKLLDSQNGTSASSVTVVGNNEVSGSATSGHFCGAADVYTVYFDIVFDRPFTASQVINEPNQPGPNSVLLTFDTTSNPTLQAKVGISFVSAANARSNWSTDNPNWSFDNVRMAAHAAWNTYLNKIQIGGGSTDRQTVFYTALYHALLHPNVFSDANGQYMGFDNQVHSVSGSQQAQYANYSGWDVYRDQFQLAAMIAPQQMSDVVQSMLNDAAQNSGQLPKWAFQNGETYVMVGDPADAEIAGAYAFGARNFDTRTALNDMLNEANNTNNVRPGLNYYLSRGYLPTDGSYGCCNFYGSVSTTLEYNAADFAISRFAAALGDSANAQKFLNRSDSWEQLYDPATQLLEPKTLAGNLVGQSPTSTNDYVEGDASQYRWMVPFDKAALIQKFGGNANFNAALDTFFTQLNAGPNSPYAFWDNQFGYEAPWSYDFSGAPSHTQDVVNRIRTQLYYNGPGGEEDNDDLGATAGMGVYTMLGFYPMYLATADVVLNSPEFPLEVIHLSSGSTLNINAPNASTTNYYVQSLNVNGTPSTKTYLPASMLASGGTLDFTMGSSPSSWGTGPNDAPPSYPASSSGGGGPTVNNPGSQSNNVGDSVHLQLTASGGSGGDTWSASGLPTGLSINSGSGLVSGTTTTAGTFDVVVTATDSSGHAGSTSFTWTVGSGGGGGGQPLPALFDNTGISDDSNQGAANLDNDGFSYSQQALTAARLGPNARVRVHGITFHWPNVVSGQPDNVQCSGQVVSLTALATARRLGFLGSAVNGGATGTGAITYTDGTTQSFTLSFGDWASAAQAGNRTVATMSYRNSISGSSDTGTTVRVFETDVTLRTGKTVATVTLPASVSGGQLHVFAVAAG